MKKSLLFPAGPWSIAAFLVVLIHPQSGRAQPAVGGAATAIGRPPTAQQLGIAGKTATEVGRDRPEDRAAIAAVARSFSQAFMTNDAKAIAKLYAEDGEVIDEHGIRFRGSAAIEQGYALLFRDRPGAKIDIKPASLRFLGPDFAQEMGRTTVTLADSGAQTSRQYVVLYGRHGTSWLYHTVYEDFDKSLSNHERLQELDWLVGEWVDEGSESLIHVSCAWTKDKNFLLREFTVHVHGNAVMTVSQRIGWDPISKQIKSWFFDSAGGFGESLWNREGVSWLIKSTGVLSDGQSATATHVLTRVNPTTARWSSLDRTIGGRVVPVEHESVLVKKPPHPSAK